MYELHYKVDSKNIIVGWYHTSFTEQSKAIHEIYTKRTPNPIHLLIDPRMRSGSLNIKALITQKYKVNGKEVGPLFRDVPFTWKTTYAERLVLEQLIAQNTEMQSFFSADDNQFDDDQPEVKSPHTDPLHATLKKLLSSLDVINSYISQVLKGEITEDKSIGRQLHSIIGSVAQIDSVAFGKVFAESVQDILLIIYLAKQVKTQVALCERIHMYTSGPLIP